ncbi:MAG: cobalt ECF transporter T component CbiQ [Clostridia bacterium]|nr:cobalt ECF transporter T component CbiQ [Clostridia bacterium]
MNKAEKSLYEIREMDDLAAGDSPVHRLWPLSKFFVTIAYIITVMSFHKYDLNGLFVYVLYPVVMFQLSGVPVRTFFRKMRIVLPLVIAVGVFNPVFDRDILLYVGKVGVSGGVVSMVTLILKGVFALMASFILVATTPIDDLCAALRMIRVPAVIVSLLLLTYRYIGVLTEEVAIMTNAYHLRAPGQKGIHISAWGSFLGQLLLRSMDRANELYASMQLRGFQGNFYYREGKKARFADILFLVLMIAVFVFLRFFPLAAWIGKLVVR